MCDCFYAAHLHTPPLSLLNPPPPFESRSLSFWRGWPIFGTHTSYKTSPPKLPPHPRPQCRVLLNLRTSQPFEEVVEDLGQVLKMTGAKRMYTAGGQEVRSFSQLRNEFADIDTFYLGTSSSVMIPPPILTADRSGNVVGSPVRRSRSRAGMSTAATAVAAASGMMGGGGGADEAIGGGAGGGSSSAKGRQRARSKSRPRVLYAPESEIVRPSGGEYIGGKQL